MVFDWEFRRQHQAKLERELVLAQEAFRILDLLGVSHRLSVIPEWLLGMAAYSLKSGIRLPNPGLMTPFHEEFFNTVRAGLRGDTLTVEMWFMAHEV